MISNYLPNVKAVITFLKLLNVKVNSKTVNETLQNHPNWPSLLCISDTLNKWNIANGVGKIEPTHIDELPTPFMAYTVNKERPLAIVTNITESIIEKRQTSYNKIELQNKTDFIKAWEGIYIIAETNEHSGEPNYKYSKRRAVLSSIIPVTAIAVILIVSLIKINKIAIAATSQIGIYFQYLILLAGVAVTSLLLWYEIDKSNPILNKVCSGIAKGNCTAILTGKQAKVFSWLSWSEVGFFYFTGSLVTFLALDKSLHLLAWLSLLALPYTIFSIYYQWRIAKQWCVLCLVVQALLLMGAINVLTNNFLLLLNPFTFSQIFNYLMLFAMPVLLWFSLKPFILKLQEAKNTKRQYLRLKFNTEIFDILLKKQKQITLPTNGIGIDIGNPNAMYQITKVCNPYCDPCAIAHPKIDEILEHNKNVKTKIIFTPPIDENNKALKPIKHLLAIAAQNNVQKTKQALDDWYLPSIKDYEIFAAKYKMNGELEVQGSKINIMHAWCNATEIAYTPTIFLNGYQLPDAYNIEDLEYFLME